MDAIANIFAGLNVSPGVAAIFGVGVLVAAMGFAEWLTDKVAGWFDDRDSPDNEDIIHAPEEVVDGALYECMHCEYQMGSDDALHALDEGHCPKCGEDL